MVSANRVNATTPSPLLPHVAAGWTDTGYARVTPLPARHLPLEGEVTADVCVIGGGYTGLAAALTLAERGRRVVVLEAERVGWGGSGRNGGQASTAFAPDMGKVRAAVGTDTAAALWAMCEEAKTLLRSRIARHAIDCDLRPGIINVAMKPREMRDLEATAADLARTYGYTQTRRIDPADIQSEVASPAYHGGVIDMGAGHLDPLPLAFGLARAAVGAGAVLHEGSRVTEIVPGEGTARPLVRTRSGAVRADAVLVCTNAYLDRLVPALRRWIMPVGTYVLATEPLGANRAAALIPNGHAVCEARWVLNYFRIDRHTRLLFGGRVSYTGLDPRDLPGAVRRAMLKIFPHLADVATETAWGGYVAITPERTPHIGRLPGGLYFAHGYSGQGVVLAGFCGTLLAEAVCGETERFDVFTRLPHLPFPGGGAFRKPLLVLAMTWYRLRDML